MTTEPGNRGKVKKSRSKRLLTEPMPDNMFKEIMEEIAQLAGLQNIATELQIRQSTRTDIVLRVPSEISLLDTLIDFFLLFTIIEFKSENDPLNEDEFYKNVMRVYAIYLQYRSYGLANFLNLIVCATTPGGFLKLMRSKGYTFKAVEGREWLLREEFGNQEVKIVICDLLPLEPKYDPWLLFAPAGEPHWEAFFKSLAISGRDLELLEKAYEMRPKEAEMIYDRLREMAQKGEISLEELEHIYQEKADAYKIGLNKFKREPKYLARALSGLKPEERLSGLKPEERLSGLKPEEREALLKLLQQQIQSENKDN